MKDEWGHSGKRRAQEMNGISVEWLRQGMKMHGEDKWFVGRAEMAIEMGIKGRKGSYL